MSMQEVLKIMENMILDSQTDDKGKNTGKNKETETKPQAGTDSVTEADAGGKERCF